MQDLGNRKSNNKNENHSKQYISRDKKNHKNTTKTKKKTEEQLILLINGVKNLIKALKTNITNMEISLPNKLSNAQITEEKKKMNH